MLDWLNHPSETKLIKTFIIWLALWSGNINHILCWLTIQTGKMVLFHLLGTTYCVPQEQSESSCSIINPSLTKLLQSRWLHSGLILLLQIYWPMRNTQKKIWPMPAILTKQVCSIAICTKTVKYVRANFASPGSTYNTTSNKVYQNSFSHQYGVPMKVFLLPMVLSNWALTPKSTTGREQTCKNFLI